MNTSGRLWSVGVGPGDPELVTIKARRLIDEADVVAYHRAPSKRSTARSIAASVITPGTLEEELVYPVTTETTDHPGGYHGALSDFYDECTRRLGDHLAAGRSVVLLAEGDPMFFGSAMYVHDMLAERYETGVVPGVTSLSAASAATGTGLCRHEDVLTVLPGTLPVSELAQRLAMTEAAVIMKLGRTFANVVEAVRQAGLLHRATYVERASREGERVLPLLDVDPETVPYMSVVVIAGADRRADAAGRAAESAHGPGAWTAPAPASDSADFHSGSVTGQVTVIGLGPGPDHWLSPQATDALQRVSHVLGYTPYVNRVPTRDGLTRLPSGNTVEIDRAHDALRLAAQGHDVAVVSGGDAGVFGMATAVFEARELHADVSTVPVDVLPGITAAHAASALAGAMLGGDHALISLSDRLKPWALVVERLRALARVDMAMALYNPRSASRPHQFGQALEVLRAEVPGERVIAVARHVGREEEALELTTLSALDPESIDMGCLVMIGASTTRITSDGRAWTPRSVGVPAHPAEQADE